MKKLSKSVLIVVMLAVAACGTEEKRPQPAPNQASPSTAPTVPTTPGTIDPNTYPTMPTMPVPNPYYYAPPPTWQFDFNQVPQVPN